MRGPRPTQWDYLGYKVCLFHDVLLWERTLNYGVEQIMGVRELF